MCVEELRRDDWWSVQARQVRNGVRTERDGVGLSVGLEVGQEEASVGVSRAGV